MLKRFYGSFWALTLAVTLVTATYGRISAEPQALRGDANNDGSITLADAIYLGKYLFAKGPAPIPDSGDANCDARVDFLDAIYLVNYVVRGGPVPKCPAS